MNRKEYSFPRTILRTLPLVWKGEPKLYALQIPLSILHGALWGVNVIVLKSFFDSVTALVSGDGALSQALWALCAVCLTMVAQQGMNGFSNYLGNYWFMRMEPHFRRRVAEKAGRIEPAEFEAPDRLDDINKALSGAQNAYGTGFTLYNSLLFYSPYFAVIGAFLYGQKPLLALALPLVFVPVLITQWIRSYVFQKVEDESAPLRRRHEYYEKTLMASEYFKETRVTGGYGFLRRHYLEALQLLTGKIWSAEKRTARWELLMRAITLAGYAGILFMLFQALMAGEITVGAFSAVFSNLGMMFGIMEEVICGHIGRMARDLGTVVNFFRFMDAPERDATEGAEGAPDGDIDLKNVSFRYRGATRDALKDVSLTIRRGETLAVVGENGAGKTTLARLIAGLYLPSEGAVSRGGADTRALSMEAARAGVSAVFQKFVRYRMTLAENVRISGARDARLIDGALDGAGLSASDACFPGGADTMLSREFDGVDLSGGQWQRVAIARGLYRPHELLILDEPTAAIDPLEESRVLGRFSELAREKTCVIVTHRMGSARIADRVVLMEDGRIAAMGTHQELLKNCPKYDEMVRAQADWYQ